MTMPGFTAEMSLATSAEHYRAMGLSGDVEAANGGTAIVPQQSGFGCFTRNLSLGPLSLSLRCCVFPPRCCLRACVVGICRSFCVPA